MRSSSKDKSADIESCKIKLAFLCKLSNGNECLKLVEVPSNDLGIISPLLWFFHYKITSEIAIKKKKIKNRAPVVR